MKKCFGIIIYTYFKEFPEREGEGVKYITLAKTGRIQRLHLCPRRNSVHLVDNELERQG